MFPGSVLTLYFSLLSNITSRPNVSSTGLIHCASRCSQRFECSSFFFKPDTRSCTPSSKRHLTASPLTPMPDHLYYIARLDCDTNWIVRGGQCYLLREDNQIAPKAKVICANYGGDLAEIGSEDENRFFLSLAKQPGMRFLIGGSDKAKPGRFTWKDGTRIPKRLWLPDEPNSWGGIEHCVVQREDGLNDGQCNASKPFLCEK